MGRVGRGYIVKFPHPMHFCLRRAKERKHTHKHTAIDGESEEFCFLVFLLSRRCRHQPTAMDGRPQKISTAWEGWEGVILLNFHTPCIFAFVKHTYTHTAIDGESEECISVQAPAYGHGRSGTEGINGVGRAKGLY